MLWEQYANKWPDEVAKANKAIGSDMPKGIFVFLLTEGRKAFSEISNEIEIPANKLSYHLKKLCQNGILINIYANEKNNRDHSFYEVSAFGHNYAKKIIEIAHAPYQHKVVPEINFHKEFKSEDNVIIMTASSTTEEAPFVNLPNTDKESEIIIFSDH